MNLQLYNLCSQFKSTQKSLDAAEHLVYSDLCYGTLSSIRNEIIWFATEKGRKRGGRVFSHIDPCFPELTLCISRLLFDKKKKENYCNATQHGILATSLMDTKPLPYNNQPLKTSWTPRSFNLCPNSWCRWGKHDLVSKWHHHGILIKFNLKKKANSLWKQWSCKHKPLKKFNILSFLKLI